MHGTKLLVTVLVIGLGSMAYGQEKPKIKRVTAGRTSPAAGPEMFKAYCAACHGIDGKGNGPAAAALTKQPTDLTQLSKKNHGKFPALIVRNIILGDDIMVAHGSRDMPVWGAVFRSMGDDLDTQMRLQNLNTYLESLQQN